MDRVPARARSPHYRGDSPRGRCRSRNGRQSSGRRDGDDSTRRRRRSRSRSVHTSRTERRRSRSRSRETRRTERRRSHDSRGSRGATERPPARQEPSATISRPPVQEVLDPSLAASVAPEGPLAVRDPSGEEVESGSEAGSAKLVAPPPSPASLGSPPQVAVSPQPGTPTRDLRVRLRRLGQDDDWRVVPAPDQSDWEEDQPRRHVEVVTEYYGILLKRVVTTYTELY